MGRLFGTDGIRGVANEYPVTPEMAMQVGKAISHCFREGDACARIVVGRDTRISGDMLEAALVSGICAMGGDALVTGVLPTPGIALLARQWGAQGAVVISASHNPYYDNGIKVFRGDGFKLSDGEEQEIEKAILGETEMPRISGKLERLGRVLVLPDAADRYIGLVRKMVLPTLSLKGLEIVLDCANGATSAIAPAVFEGLGATVTALCIQPDGTNINDGCGSEHLAGLAEAVVDKKARVGFAFDGDGDRVLCVDEKGEKISGDKMLAIYAKAFKRQDRLPNNLVVSTVMSNIGLGLALKALGVGHVIAPVGDRYVLQEMLATGARIGGEDSGHMIFLDHHTTGDGILAALQIAGIMKETGQPLSGLAGVMKVFPQVLMNLEVKDKPPLEDLPEVTAAIARVERQLGDEGRVLIRYSGTQPLCRVMVEGPTREVTERFCREIVDAVRIALG